MREQSRDISESVSVVAIAKVTIDYIKFIHGPLQEFDYYVYPDNTVYYAFCINKLCWTIRFDYGSLIAKLALTSCSDTIILDSEYSDQGYLDKLVRLIMISRIKEAILSTIYDKEYSIEHMRETVNSNIAQAVFIRSIRNTDRTMLLRFQSDLLVIIIDKGLISVNVPPAVAIEYSNPDIFEIVNQAIKHLDND